LTYIIRIGPWHVGPFDTHIDAQDWAERHGCDDYTMVLLDHPATFFVGSGIWSGTTSSRGGGGGGAPSST